MDSDWNIFNWVQNVHKVSEYVLKMGSLIKNLLRLKCFWMLIEFHLHNSINHLLFNLGIKAFITHSTGHPQHTHISSWSHKKNSFQTNTPNSIRINTYIKVLLHAWNIFNVGCFAWNPWFLENNRTLYCLWLLRIVQQIWESMLIG